MISYSSGISYCEYRKEMMLYPPCLSVHDLISYFSLDLVAVSSTVIPESDMPNQEEITAEMDKEYKKAYFSLFKKKFDSKFEKPDTLMTNKKKFAKNSEKLATKKPE